ncbi:MAG: ATP-binding protein [Elusimicrobia bacterium]|nr:ATP-binding protein [Elusimicrobiota bacterium]
MKRHYLSLLLQYLKYFPCVALIGPRQCGKTTLLKQLPKGWSVFDLEKIADYEVVSGDADLFFRLNPERVALDEAQLLPKIFPALRVAIDAQRRKKGRFVITGSSSPDLQRSISESLAGRAATIEMAPFSCAEALALKPSPFFSFLQEGRPLPLWIKRLKPRKSLRQIHDYWWRGGYPEPWLEKNSRFHGMWMDQYIQTYLYRDLARLFPGLNQQRFRLFTQMLAGLSGTIINYSQVAGLLGVSAPTARDYFEIAHGSFLWRKLAPYEKKTVKRIVKHPKGYLRDTGLIHHLLRLPDLNALLGHPQKGFSWEALVIEEILRGLNAGGVSCECYFYRTAAGAEVDLVLEGAFGTIPIEVKYSQAVKAFELRSLSHFIEEKKCSYGLVINNDEKSRLYSKKILGIPFSCL